MASSVKVSIDVSSIDTSDAKRDEHLRSSDFFDIDKHPTMTFSSTEVRPDGGDYVVTGDLTLHGVTSPVELAVELNGVGPDPWGGNRSGSRPRARSAGRNGASTRDADRGGGVVVGDKVKLHLEVEAVLQGCVTSGAAPTEALEIAA